VWKLINQLNVGTKMQCPVLDIDPQGNWKVYYGHRTSDNITHLRILTVSPLLETVIKDAAYPLLPGYVGRFDTYGMLPSSIYRDGDDTYLYYVGWGRRPDVAYQNSTGVLVTNKEHGIRRFGPIIGPSSDDKSLFTGTMSVIKISADYYIGYYLRCYNWIKGEPIYDISVATSRDLIHWKRNMRGTTMGINLLQDEGGISQFNTVKYGDKYIACYSTRGLSDFRGDNLKESYRIETLSSDDGYNWKTMMKGIYPDNDNNMYCYPYPFVYEDELYMLSNGHNFGDTGILVWKYDTSI